MEAQNVSKELKANIQVLAERKAKREEEVAKIDSNLKQLKQERKVALNDVAILYGAIQAYEAAVQVVGREAPANDEVKPDVPA